MEELGIYSFSQDDFWEKIFGSEWADDPHQAEPKIVLKRGDIPCL